MLDEDVLFVSDEPPPRQPTESEIQREKEAIEKWRTETSGTHQTA
jgi:hypothetical protein